MRDDAPSLFDSPYSRFDPDRLTQARILRGLSKTGLAHSVGVSAAAVGQYEAGVNSPRPDVVEKLARALSVQPGFFNAGRPTARLGAIHAHFRSLRSARVSERQRALAQASLYWELTFALERYVRLPDAGLPDLLEGTSPSGAAAALRTHWQLPDGPVRHLVATAESHGVIVAIRPLRDLEDVDAFSAVILDRPFIIPTPRRSENVFRHRFSIAHEIGHLLLHRDNQEPSAAIEKEADAFAAAFLTPAAAMDAVLPTRLDLAKLDRIGRTWGVSAHSLVLRMLERGHTTESSARRAYQRLAAINDPLADPTRAYPGEMPSLLKQAVALADEVGTGIPVLADQLKVHPAQIRNLLGDDDPRPTLRLVRDPD